MKSINTKKQYKKQLEYFGKEFGAASSYKLAAWQKSYIERIKKDVLDKNYRGKTLLDVATGSGYVAVEMAKLGLKVIATDLTPESIDNIERYKKQFNLKNLTVKKSLAEKLELPTDSVDFLVANAILEHIPHEKKAISEWKRVVKPNGKLFVTTPLKFRYIYPFLWLPNYLHDKRIGHLRRYDLNDYQQRFKLPILKIYYTGHLIKIVGIIISILTKKQKYDAYFERLDRKNAKKKYGANNITVIMQNVK